MELDYKAIGKRIKIARIKKNLTQETVADRIGVTPQHVKDKPWFHHIFALH